MLYSNGLSVADSHRYSWYNMVILLTPFMLIMAVVQAAIDNNRLAINIIGAIVSYLYTAASCNFELMLLTTFTYK